MDRLPPGRECAETGDDVRALAAFMEGFDKAQSMERHSVRGRAAEQFNSKRIVDKVVTAASAGR